MIFVVAFCLCLLGLCDGSFYTKNSGVVSLTPKNFKSVVESPGVTLVEFYAPWCGHCKKLTPEWIKAAKKMEGAATFAAIDCDSDQNKQLAQKYQIQGFPTIKAFIGKGPPEDYNGPRTAQGLIDYATSKIPSFVKPVKDGSETEFLDNQLPKALLFTKKSTTSLLYKSLSGTFKDKILFGEARSKRAKKLAKKFGVNTFPTLFFIPASEDDTEPLAVRYDGKLKAKSIRNFLTLQLGEELDEEKLPVLHDQSCMNKYCITPGGLCAILITSADTQEATKYHGILKDVEDSRSDSLFTFVMLDGVKQQKFVQQAFGMTVDFTKLVVFSAKKKSYIEFLGAYTEDNVEEFLQGILNGRQKPVSMKVLPELEGDTSLCKEEKPPKKSKSEKSRSSNVNYVVALTTGNFSDVISNRKLPMMVEFFAPWCGHCKSLAPEWAKAAKNLKGMVTFATVDATVETTLAQQYKIQGYPTIKFFPVKPTEDPLEAQDYTGQRTAKALSSHAVNLLSDHDVVELTALGHVQEWFGETQQNPKVMLFSEKTAVPTMFKALSIALSDSLEFGFITSSLQEVVDQFQVTKFPQIMLMALTKPEDGDEDSEPQMGLIAYDGPLKFPAIYQWLSPIGGAKEKENQKDKSRAEPVDISVSKITSQQDFQRECVDKLGLCVVAFLDEHAAEEAGKGESMYVETLLKIATAYPHDPYHFAWMSREGQSTLMDAFGLSYDGPIAMVVMNARKKVYTNYIGSYTEDSIHEFLTSVLSGRLRTSSINNIPEVVELQEVVSDNGDEIDEYASAVDIDECQSDDGVCAPDSANKDEL